MKYDLASSIRDYFLGTDIPRRMREVERLGEEYLNENPETRGKPVNFSLASKIGLVGITRIMPSIFSAGTIGLAIVYKKPEMILLTATSEGIRTIGNKFVEDALESAKKYFNEGLSLRKIDKLQGDKRI